MSTYGLPPHTGTSLTLDEYECLPEEDGHKQELAAGRLVREPRPGARHGVIVGNLFRALDSFVRERDLGRVVIETGFLLVEEPPTVRGLETADSWFVYRVLGDPATGDVDTDPSGIPGMHVVSPSAVEVVSPSDSAAGIQEKVLQYLDAGTETIWVVQPRTRTVEIWRAGADVRVIREEEALEGVDALPGWRFDLKSLFEF